MMNAFGMVFSASLIPPLVEDANGLPEGAIAYADFKNGTYYYGGNVLADFLTQDTGWGVFDPATVQAGIGLAKVGVGNNANPVLATALATELLASGFTAVFTYTRTVAVGEPCIVVIEMLDLPNWNNEWVVGCLGADGKGSIFDYTTDLDLESPIQGPGQHRAAFTLSDGALALSVDGVSPIAAVPVAASPNTIALQVDNGVALETFVIYPPAANGDLAGLSALT